MAIQRKRMIGFGAAVIILLILTVAGGLIAKADSDTWTSHADTTWFDPIYTTFTIDSPEKLAGVARLVNEDPGGAIDGLAGKILEIDRSLDLSAYEWMPIGTGDKPFKGTLIAKAQGNFEISGMHTPGDLSYHGLVGNMAGGTVGGFIFTEGQGGRISASSATYDVYAGVAVGKMSGVSIVYNITNYIGIEADSINGQSYAGGIVGMGEGTIANSFNHSGITGNGSAYAGGIVGYGDTAGLKIKKVTNNGPVQINGRGGSGYAGGIAGYAAGSLGMDEDTTPIGNTGTVAVTGSLNSYAGGIAGKVDGLLSFSELTSNTGAVSIDSAQGAASYAGGLVGSMLSQQAKAEFSPDFANTAAVTNHGGANVYTGGVAGYMGSGLSWSKSYTSGVVITASGTENVYTGGIAGYASGANIGNVSFTGEIHAAGGSRVYSGGIAGYADGATVSGKAGNTEDHFAAIVADGTVGGIAGYLNGTISGAAVKFIELRTTSDGGVVGGVAGSAQGTISAAVVGAADSGNMNSVRMEAAADGAAEGKDNITSGGIVGLNSGALTVQSSSVSRIGLLTEAGGSGYIFGGIAGLLSADAVIGQADAPLPATSLQLDLLPDDSAVGGAVGLNRSPAVYVKVKDLELALAGGGSRLGAVFGENHSTVTGASAEHALIRSEGAGSALGGIAGLNTGSLTDVQGIDISMEASGADSSAGGIAGRSTGASAAGRASISGAVLLSGEEPLVTSDGDNVNAGGIVGYAAYTDISQPKASAETPNYVILSLKAPGAAAGGIAGRIEDGNIAGDAQAVNIGNLMITTAAEASGARIGGIAGYNERTRQERMVTNNTNLIVNGPASVAGGMAGYNLSTNTAIITGNYTSELSIKANASAEASVIGGLVGRNAARDSDPAANPGSGVSTIQNSRALGKINAASPSTITGGMVGENGSLIANNSITDKIPVVSKGNGSTVGGLAGVNTASGTLYYTYSNANLTIEGQNTLAGGLVGDNAGAIKSSYVDIDITGKAYGTSSRPIFLGGLAGRNSGSVELSYTSSKVTAEGSYAIVGGLVGDQTAGGIKNSYVAKSVNATKDHSYAGGFIGRIVNGKISYAYSAAEVTGTGGAYAGGFAGRYDNASKELLYKSYYIKDQSLNINKDLPDFAEGNHRWLNIQGRLSTILSETLKDRTSFPPLSGWDFADTWKYGSLSAAYQYPEVNRSSNTGGDGGDTVNANINWYMKDKGAIHFEITSEAELAGLASIVNGTIVGVEKFDFADRTVTVKNPIHIQSKQWTPIGDNADNPFQGTFDGGGHLIDGLTVLPVHHYSGLFGVVGAQAKLTQITLEPRSVEGLQYTGTVAGLNLGTVSNAEVRLVDGARVSGLVTGGIIGKNTGSMAGLRLVTNDGKITALYNNAVIGGIVGENASDIGPGTYAIEGTGGKVFSAADNAVVGGVVGQQTGGISGLSAVFTPEYAVSSTGAGGTVGGLIGHFVSGEAKDLSVSFAGGLLEAGGQDSVLGGLIGRSDSGSRIIGVKVDAASPGTHLRANGAAGGIVGVKEGTGANSFDVEHTVTGAIGISVEGDSLHAQAGGLAARMVNTAVNDVSAGAVIRASGDNAVAGGIAGLAEDSILYGISVDADISVSGKSGESAVGGVTGILSAADRDRGYDFGKRIPLYNGIYNANVQGKGILAEGAGQQGELYAGGIAGKNLNASIYESDAASGLEIGGSGAAAAGGIAGYNSGILVGSSASVGIHAGNARVYHIGGVVGKSENGEIHYTTVASPNGEKIAVDSAVSAGDELPATQAGGFVGMGDGTTITHSSADIAVQLKDANPDSTLYAGGFAGLLGDSGDAQGMITDSFAKGAVTVSGVAGSHAGGFAGSVDNYGVRHAYASGNVDNTGLDTRTGGFAAAVERAGTVTDAYALGRRVAAAGVKSATRSYTGGFAGYNDGLLTGAHADVAELSVSVKGSNVYQGALVGYNFRDGKISGSTYTGDSGSVGRNAGGAVDAARTATVDPGASGAWITDVDTRFLSGEAESEAVIDNGAQLAGAVLFSNSTGLDYYRLYNRTAAEKPALNKLALGADVDLAGAVFTPFDSFDGVFDGRGHVISGLRLAGSGKLGFIAINHGIITNVVFKDAVSESSEDAAIVAGSNGPEADIRGIVLQGAASVTASGRAGGVVVDNAGTIADVKVERLALQGGTMAGGIAAANAGTIGDSYTGGVIKANAPSLSASAGGIAGEHMAGAVIARSFSFADVTATADEALAGGIAGRSGGEMDNLYSAGHIGADGKAEAMAGGIAGYAEAGVIRHSVSTGGAASQVNGQIVPKLALFGGIAGRKADAASIESSLYNKQMLKNDTAYYNAEGIRARGDAGGASGRTAAELTSGALPEQLDAALWQAEKGFYPGLAAWSGSPEAQLAAAAVILDPKDTIHRITSGFQLSADGTLSWRDGAGLVAIAPEDGVLKGKLQTEGSAVLTAASGALSRQITINAPALKFAESAAKPKVTAGEKVFEDKTAVELGADEPGGRIYYTLDGQQPDEFARLYTGPIALDNSATVKAITVADQKEPSDVMSADFEKKPPTPTPTPSPSPAPGGGGGGYIAPSPSPMPTPVPKPAVAAVIGDKTAEGAGPIAVAKNSKLTLTAEEGQIIYYTTDGTEPTTKSRRYTEPIVVKGAMTIKAITDKDDRVVTIVLTVKNADYSLKSNAAEIKYISAYPDGSFKPEQAITRYELIDALTPLLDMEQVSVANLFPDVSWDRDSRVAFFASAGIVEGYPNGRFEGGKGLTRAEFSVIMTRVLALDTTGGAGTTLKDMGNHWSRQYVDALVEAGYVKGFPDGTFKPQSAMTRAQAVVLINRIIGVKAGLSPVRFKDVPSGHWAYQDIMASAE